MSKKAPFSIETSDDRYQINKISENQYDILRFGEAWRTETPDHTAIILAHDLASIREKLVAAGIDPAANAEVPKSYGPDNDLLNIQMSNGHVLIQKQDGDVYVQKSRKGERESHVGDGVVLSLGNEIEHMTCLAKEAGLNLQENLDGITLSPWHTSILKTYGDGDFAYLTEQSVLSRKEMSSLGDGFLAFVLRETSVEEDCADAGEAIRRIQVITRDIADIEAAISIPEHSAEERLEP